MRSPVSGSSEAVGSSEQQDVRVVEQGLGERQPGPLASGKGAARPVHEGGQVQFLRQLPDPPRRPAQAVEQGIDRQVLARAQPFRQIDIRRGEIHPRQHVVAPFQHVDAEHRHRPRGRQQQSQQDGDRRRLARTVAAKQRRRRPLRHAEGQAVDGSHVVIGFCQVRNPDGRRRIAGLRRDHDAAPAVIIIRLANIACLRQY